MAELGLEVGAWQDGIVHKFEPPFPRDKFASKNVTVCAWKNVWETGMASDIYKLANADYQVRKNNICCRAVNHFERNTGLGNESACLAQLMLGISYSVVCSDRGHANRKILHFARSDTVLVQLLVAFFFVCLSLSTCISHMHV